MIRYPQWLRTLPALAATASTAMAVADMWYLYGALLQVARTKMQNWDGSDNGSLFIFGIVGPAAVIMTAWMARSAWHFLFLYRVYDDGIRVHDPVFSTTVHYSWQNLSGIHAFKLVGPPPMSLAANGHRLSFLDGQAIVVTEALPMWSMIESHANSALIRPGSLESGRK